MMDSRINSTKSSLKKLKKNETLDEVDVEVKDINSDETYTTKLTPSEIDQISNDEQKYDALIRKLRYQKFMCDSSAEETAPGSSKEESNNTTKWTSDSIKLLLNEKFKIEEEFDNPKTRKTKLWQKVATAVNTLGSYDYTPEECHTKFRNLLQTYKINKTKKFNTGDSRVKWEFFEIFDLAIGEKASVIPPAENLSTINDSDSYAQTRKPKKIQKNELTLTRYLYLKQINLEKKWKADKEKWEEKKELKRLEIDAINNLAKALSKTNKRKKSDSDSD